MNNIIAAFTFFTRLPLGKLSSISVESFKRMVCYWSLTGWLTGGVMAATLYITSLFFPITVAVIITFISRILLTGALHEDGLADFIDGMGGGHTRTRILEIMKDSTIGSYGVLGLILYTTLWIASVITLVTLMPVTIACIYIFTGDVWSKWNASQLINILPYARNATESKNKFVYERMTMTDSLIGFGCAILPLLLMITASAYGYIPLNTPYWFSTIYLAPMITMGALVFYMKKRINGYTGDCCGAAFLLCELLYLLSIPILWKFI